MAADAARTRSLLARPSGRDAGVSAEAVDQIWDDLFARNGNEIVAYRNERRWTRDYEALPLNDAAKGAESFRKGGVYLLTGGLGDLGMSFARNLAAEFNAKLVLVGRAELPERAAWANYLSTYGEADRIGRAIARANG